VSSHRARGSRDAVGAGRSDTSSPSRPVVRVPSRLPEPAGAASLLILPYAAVAGDVVHRLPAVDRCDAGEVARWHTCRVPTPRFLQLADVAEVLNISAAQVYALVRNGDLPAIKIGGRGQWRVEVAELEAYIARMYEQTREFVHTHPLTRGEDDEGDDGEEGAEA
jgi:excisionase family DNA binding protein